MIRHPNQYVAMKLLLVSTITVLLSPSEYFCQASWIDPDTPAQVRTTRSYMIPNSNDKDGEGNQKQDDYKLVFSDEFNIPGRSFGDGSDPRWTALEKNDYTNDALHYYSAANAKTNENGELVITTEAIDTTIIGQDDKEPEKKVVEKKHFRSAMLQSWNKFCFTGGIIEARATMPGKSDVGGLWPAFWLLGNLARHTYVASSKHIWPWSSNTCTEKAFYAQQISACSQVEHYGLAKGVGRGAPEVDIFEVQGGNIKHNTGVFVQSSVGQPFMSASFQVAPGRPDIRPGPGYWPGPCQWYEGLVGGDHTNLNINFYGDYNHFATDANPQSDYWSDAISYNRQLDERHWDSSHVYRLEWDVPTNEKDGYLHWFLDGELVLAINGTGIREGGTGSEISTEPSYIIMNTAVSSQWGFPNVCPDNCPCKQYNCNSNNFEERCGFSDGFCDMMTKGETSPQYKVDWVRVYQDPTKEEQKVGCSTPERPSRRYIEAHEKSYMMESDEHPLKPILAGGGDCDPTVPTSTSTLKSCGGEERGRCNKKKLCQCKAGWTGPHCLASKSYNAIEWDPDDKLSDFGFVPPKFSFNGLIVGLSIFVIVLLTAAKWRRQLLEGWTPIPNVETKRLAGKRNTAV